MCSIYERGGGGGGSACYECVVEESSILAERMSKSDGETGKGVDFRASSGLFPFAFFCRGEGGRRLIHEDES